jgi:hypothetical protein
MSGIAQETQKMDEYLNGPAMLGRQAGAAIGGAAAHYGYSTAAVDQSPNAKEAPLLQMGRLLDDALGLSVKLEERLGQKADFLCGAVPQQDRASAQPPSLANGAFEAVNERLRILIGSLHRAHEHMSRLDRTIGQ